MRRRSPVDLAVGVAILVAAVVHAAAHVLAGRWYDVFWVCNVSALLLGPAILLRSPRASAVALIWLFPGTLVWLADAIFAHAGILPTSWGVHLGGSAAAVYAVRRNGHAPKAWAWALALLAVLVAFSRAVLPAAANVDAAHGVPRGWSFLGGSAPSFAFAGVALAIAIALLGARLARAIAVTARRAPFAAERDGIA